MTGQEKSGKLLWRKVVKAGRAGSSDRPMGCRRGTEAAHSVKNSALLSHYAQHQEGAAVELHIAVRGGKK